MKLTLPDSAYRRIAKVVKGQEGGNLEDLMDRIPYLDRQMLDELADDLGMWLPGETYQETADRLRSEGDDEYADVFELMEMRWVEVEG